MSTGRPTSGEGGSHESPPPASVARETTLEYRETASKFAKQREAERAADKVAERQRVAVLGQKMEMRKKRKKRNRTLKTAEAFRSKARSVSVSSDPPAPGSATTKGSGSHHQSEQEAHLPAKGWEPIGTQEDIQHGETSAAAPGDSSSASPAAPSSKPSVRPRFPPYPSTGSRKDLRKWQDECREIRAFLAADPDNDLPTRRGPKDPDSARAVHSLAHKAVIGQAARSIVSVSSARQDGFMGAQCTGIIIDKWEGPDAGGRQRFVVVTCSKIVCKDGKLLDPVPEVSVVLPNAKTILDVHLLHVSDHYDIAILSVAPDVPLELPSIGPGPEYGQEVFLLARDSESSLMVRKGEIKWLEESDYLGRNYYMFLSCKLPKGGNGGQLIDDKGNIRGMSFYLSPHPAVISISTVITCVNMFIQFNRIARPMFDLGLRTVAFMDVEKQDAMFHKYGISHGLIVDTVPYDSHAEKLGIRRGNVILSLGERDNLTLPELEDYLLSVGCECLKRNLSESGILLMVEVRDLNESSARTLKLPVPLS